MFTMSCGGTSSSNNTYAIVSSYSTSSDKDPCTYKFCKTNSDICKLRIDFDTMVLSGTGTISSTSSYLDGTKVGDCQTDTLTVSNPGGAVPPTICGYNTGQVHYIKLDIETLIHMTGYTICCMQLIMTLKTFSFRPAHVCTSL